MTDQKNTLLAIVLSALVLIGWQVFFGLPQVEKQKQVQQQQAQDRAQYSNDLTRFGGSNFDVLYGPGPGTIIVGNQTWAIPKALSGATLTLATLTPGTSNLYDNFQGSYVTPEEERWSVFSKETQRLTDELQLHFEGLFTRRKMTDIAAASFPLALSVPASNPYYINPAGGTDNVTVLAGTSSYFASPIVENRIDTGNFSVGLATSPFERWTADVTAGYTFERQHVTQSGSYNAEALDAALSDPNPATAFNPFGGASSNNPATLASIAGVSRQESVSTLRTLGLTTAGPLIALPGGDLELSVGAEYRIQDFNTTFFSPHTAAVSSGDLSRNIIRAVVDEYDIADEGGVRRFRLVKRSQT